MCELRKKNRRTEDDKDKGDQGKQKETFLSVSLYKSLFFKLSETPHVTA